MSVSLQCLVTVNLSDPLLSLAEAGSHDILLDIPGTEISKRAFSVTSLQLWNSLPLLELPFHCFGQKMYLSWFFPLDDITVFLSHGYLRTRKNPSRLFYMAYPP